MRRADIKTDGTEYAVRLPLFRYGRRDGSAVQRATIEDATSSPPKVVGHVLDRPGGSWDMGGSYFSVPCSAVVSTWHDHVVSEAHDEALHEDSSRVRRAEYEAECATRAARIEAFLPYLAGLLVPAESLSSGNFERAPVELAEHLRDVFVNDRASGTMFGWEVFEAVAERIKAMQEAALIAGSGWASGAEPVRDGTREVTALTPRASSTLAALEAAAEAAE